MKTPDKAFPIRLTKREEDDVEFFEIKVYIDGKVYSNIKAHSTFEAAFDAVQISDKQKIGYLMREMAYALIKESDADSTN